MNTEALNTIAAFFALIGALAACAFAGYCLGKSRGVAAGWLEHYFATVAEDRARRAKDGTFQTTKKTTHHD